MTGHIRKRGDSSWELKFDIGRDPVTGKRRTRYKNVKGTKRNAQIELVRLQNEVNEGLYIAPTKETVADLATHWLDNVAPTKAGAKTLERYAIIVEKNIIPELGNVPLRKLQAPAIEKFYAKLRIEGRKDGKGGLSEQSVLHIHRVLSQIIGSALKKNKIKINPLQAVENNPRQTHKDIQIVEDADLSKLLISIKGTTLYVPVLLAASTAMRRGEVLGLRWGDIDFERRKLRVRKVVEQTKQHGMRFKEPKTKHSLREITLSTLVVEELRRHKREQAMQRLQLGLGKDANDLVFSTWDGQVRSPNGLTNDFRLAVKSAGIPPVTFHGLRHTHISTLLRERIPSRLYPSGRGIKTPR